MTRNELASLKEALRLLGNTPLNDWRKLSAHQRIFTLIVNAEAEHEAEDRHNDWAELAEHSHQIAAE